ncbi:acyltransferase family protein [Rhizobium binxianense]
MQANVQKLKSIQALRGIAALMVAAFHFFLGKFVVGAAGVDVFFVISGFIMGTIGIGEKPGQFAIRRILRIVPLYWICTFAMCVGSLFGVFTNFTFDTESLLKSLFFIPYWDATGRAWPLVVVGWTLNIEMFFYLIFTIGLVLRAPIVLTSIVLALCAILGFAIDPKSAVIASWTSPLLLEFIAGLLLSRIAWASPSYGTAMLIAGVAGFVAAHVFGWTEESYRLLTWGLPALLLVNGAVFLEKSGRWFGKATKPLEIIGDASYSLYLTHGIVASATHRFLGGHVVTSLAGLVVSILLAILVYKFVEMPLLRYLKRLTSAPRVVVSPA